MMTSTEFSCLYSRSFLWLQYAKQLYRIFSSWLRQRYDLMTPPRHIYTKKQTRQRILERLMSHLCADNRDMWCVCVGGGDVSVCALLKENLVWCCCQTVSLSPLQINLPLYPLISCFYGDPSCLCPPPLPAPSPPPLSPLLSFCLSSPSDFGNQISELAISYREQTPPIGSLRAVTTNIHSTGQSM